MGGMHGFGLTDRALAELYRTTRGEGQSRP